MAQVLTSSKNYIIGSNSDVLNTIHEEEVNISIYNRDTTEFMTEVDNLMNKKIDIRLSGTIDEIIRDLAKEFGQERFGRLASDIENLMKRFAQVSKADSFRLFLGTVNTNMCRKFHTDINDLRMLCTYSGPGTMWLKEENINREALGRASSDEEDIVVNENDIQQAETGSVVILKGAIYPKAGTRAAVHRSPTIEETGEKRLLLRIDTNSFLS
jgi:hypothetical protein